jgi:hypothetical protein
MISSVDIHSKEDKKCCGIELKSSTAEENFCHESSFLVTSAKVDEKRLQNSFHL